MRMQLSNAVVGCPAAKTVILCLADGIDPRSPRELADTLSYYDVKNTLVKCFAIAMIVLSVVYTNFGLREITIPGVNIYSNLKLIKLGGKPL